MRHAYEFVGGPQDGQTLDVPEPVFSGLELRVRPPEPYLPYAPYEMQEDGRFHFVGRMGQSMLGAPADSGLAGPTMA